MNRPQDNGGTEQPLLKIRDLQTVFSTEDTTVRAVNGVDLTIYPRQTVAVVGESGCGKSVTALSALRLIPSPPGRIAGGSITFDGRDLLSLSEKQMRRIRGNQIAMIFQEPMTSLNPVYTVGWQIIEAIRLHRSVSRKEAAQIAEEALREVGIPEPAARLRQYPHEMSGGMRQRIMIAMALACRPRLLLADEPTTALDVTIQAQILELLRRLQDEHDMSVMLITHDLGVVAENADAVAVMYAGRVVEYGSVDAIFENPLHPYTQGLFMSIPRLGETRHRLQTIPGQVPNPTALPAGCPFHPRCHVTSELAGSDTVSADETVQLPAEDTEAGAGARPVMARCVDRNPGLLEVEPGHWAACWYTTGYAEGRETKPDVRYRRSEAAEHAV